MKYIGYYDSIENKKENRNYVLAATNKIDYILCALNQAGKAVELISASETRGNKPCKGKRIDLNNGNTLKLFYSLGRGSKVRNVLNRGIVKILMFFYLMRTIKKGEKVIVYHSLGYMRLIELIQRIKKCYLVLEVEEIYGDVLNNAKTKEREIKFFKKADAYIFPTVFLHHFINEDEKPYSIIHGTYAVEEDRNVSFDDGRIHIVYAGTFDPRKGVYAAIQATDYLPENYHLHVLGFGTNKEVENVKKMIEESNAKGKATVSYDGLLSGEEYICFLQKCQIGLSTQNPDAAFNATSFPSKVLSYMANGLRVVTIRIPAIEGSAVAENLYYYDNQTPEEIAKAIEAIDFQDGYNSRKKIFELHQQFAKDLKDLLENK